MPPHGRRRFSNLSIFLALLFIFASTASAASAVLGIDLGTEYIKAVLVKPGVPLDIVLTKDSKRKEVAAVAFKGLRTRVNTVEQDAFPERIYGGDAVALSARFPGDVFPNLKPLLGLKQTSEFISEYSSRYPEIQNVEWSETGTVGLKSDSFVKEEQPFLVEELLAMELKNIKANAETMAGKGYAIEDVVITVPSFYTVEQRKAITLAADLAGLRVLSLISDGLAVGLNYATSRTFPTVNEGGKPEIHLVFDMGAGSTTATVLKFQGRTVKDIGKYNKTIQEVQVLGTSWDNTFGGDTLNSLIMEDIIDKFTSKSQLKALGLKTKHVKAHGRTMAKLWKESEKIRQVLSANTETTSSFESLYYEDQNLKYKLSRSDFEKLAAEHLNRVQAPLEAALESAKLTLADLDSVILHGGAVRTPFVQKQLEAAIKDTEKIRTNVNSDEAAVFGAAFKAAAISPSFRVKEIRAADSAVFPVFASWKLDDKHKQQKLFVPTSLVGAEKQVSFKFTTDFNFKLFQQTSHPLTDLPVSSIKTLNLTESVKQLTSKAGCAESDVSTKFAIRLSPMDGLPEVVSGTISCEATEVKKPGVVDGMKDFLGFGSKKGDQEPLKEDDADADPSASTTSSEGSTSTSTSSSETETSESTASASAKAEEKPKEKKPKTETMQIGFTTEMTGSLGVKPESLSRMKTRLAAFDASDRSRVLREETLNSLEGYTYKIRDTLEDEAFIAASTSEQRDEIEQKSNDASMWLYGDGAEAGRDVLKAKLDELRGLVNPVQKRKTEAAKRPEEIKKLQDAISQADTMVTVMKQQEEAQKVSESAASSSTTTESSSNTTPATSAGDDFADLDDEPVTSTTTTSAIPEAPKPMYSEEDLKAMTELEVATKQWLEEKLAEQAKLSPTDDPVLLTSDLAAKSKELSDAVMNLLTRMAKPSPKSKKAKPSTKTAKTKSTSSSSSSASSSPTVDGTESTATTEGAWEEQSAPIKLNEEELKKMMDEQEEIDVNLAAEKERVVNKGKSKTKEKKPKAAAKKKDKGKKGKNKSTGKGKDKEEL